MRKINTYITEKLKLSKNLDNKKIIYRYHPETKEELSKLIKQYLLEDKTDLNDIDVSNITDMTSVFSNVDLPSDSIKEIDISKWDVSNVTNMDQMFYMCKNLECDLSKWDVSNVTNMDSMFAMCEKFNSDLSLWNVGKVTNMDSMFYMCEEFDSDLHKWDVSNVEVMDGTFMSCKKFNSDLTGWDVRKVRNMQDTFSGCISFEGKGLETWKPDNCRLFEEMFYDCKSMKKTPSWYEGYE